MDRTSLSVGKKWKKGVELWKWKTILCMKGNARSFTKVGNRKFSENVSFMWAKYHCLIEWVVRSSKTFYRQTPWTNMQTFTHSKLQLIFLNFNEWATVNGTGWVLAKKYQKLKNDDMTPFVTVIFWAIT